MPYYKIEFTTNPIDSGVSRHDRLYYANETNGVLDANVYAGNVVAVSHSSVTVESILGVGLGIGAPGITPYVFFAKPKNINESSVKGYYADLTMQNSTDKKAELFSVASQVSPSSK